MFGLFKLLFRVARAAVSVIAAVVRTIADITKTIVRQVTMRVGTWGSYSAGWDAFLFRQINWKRAILGQEEMDKERDRLSEELEDDDRNGIPDLYDEEVTSPGADFLGIKYPSPLLRENDYVRYLPRRLGAMAQPVPMGGKGLIRSETVNNIGQIVMVKWNALNPRGPVDAPLYPCNAMDLHRLGHVSGSQLTR